VNKAALGECCRIQDPEQRSTTWRVGMNATAAGWQIHRQNLRISWKMALHIQEYALQTKQLLQLRPQTRERLTVRQHGLVVSEKNK
jgi:hypothetical protein